MGRLGVIEVVSEDALKRCGTRGLVYFVRRESDKAIKIGCTFSPRGRFGMLAKNFGPITLLGGIPGHRKLEAELHARFKAYHIGHEWHKPAPELLDFIEQSTYTLNIRQWFKVTHCGAFTVAGWQCCLPPSTGKRYCHIHEKQESN